MTISPNDKPGMKDYHINIFYSDADLCDCLLSRQWRSQLGRLSEDSWPPMIGGKTATRHPRGPLCLATDGNRGENRHLLAPAALRGVCTNGRGGPPMTGRWGCRRAVDRPTPVGRQPTRRPSKSCTNMRGEEFESLLDRVQTEEFGDLTTDEFFTALSALADVEAPRETIELRATVKDGQLTFLELAPLPAHGNEIRFGDKRVVIKLVPEEASNVAP